MSVVVEQKLENLLNIAPSSFAFLKRLQILQLELSQKRLRVQELAVAQTP